MILVVEFPRYRTRTVDVVVEAVKDAFQEVWWLVNPCSPPRIGGEHGIVSEERQIKVFTNSALVSVSSVLKTSSTVSLLGRTELVLDTSGSSYRFLVRTSAPPLEEYDYPAQCYALRVCSVRHEDYDHPYGDAEAGVETASSSVGTRRTSAPWPA
jgi:hypothetical protein